VTSSSRSRYAGLAARERQIMDIVHRRGQATAEEVRGELPDHVSNSAVRGMLRLLEKKGHLRHERQGARFVHRPAGDPEHVRRVALEAVVHTFFQSSAGSAAAALLELYDARLTDEELDGLEVRIARARKRRGAR
jgi:predicted transcriptional regulator